MYYEIILNNMVEWLQLKGLLGGEVTILNIYTFNEFHKNANYRTNWGKYYLGHANRLKEETLTWWNLH